MDTLVSASLLGCNLCYLAEEIRKIENAGADYIHFDVMDGSFVSNVSFGEPLLNWVKKYVSKPIDTHLMVSNPLRCIENYATLGSDIITFHVEADDEPEKVIEKIHSFGVGAGIAIKPETPVSVVEKYISSVDMVLVMTVNPGFGGQMFLPETLKKVEQVREIINKLDKPIRLQVDGGINRNTARLCREAGADVLVSGSYVFGSENATEAVLSLR